eukprot:1157873-Pelagomonas_calceolata.AAC.1
MRQEGECVHAHMHGRVLWAYAMCSYRGESTPLKTMLSCLAGASAMPVGARLCAQGMQHAHASLPAAR